MRRLLALLAVVLPGAGWAQTVLVGAREDGSAGYLVGRVCLDADGDSVCGPEEAGLPKLKVVTSDGSFAVTDADGRYHLAGQAPRRTEVDASGAVREGYGRVLVKLDLGGLRGAEVVSGNRRVVETGPAMLHSLDFPVRFAAASAADQTAPRLESRGLLRGGRPVWRLRLAREAGHRLRVDGREVGVEGAAEVELRHGPNVVAVTDLGPGGELVFYRQRVGVVRRERGGVLFLPASLERVARVQLPDPEAAPVGGVAIAVSGVTGARVTLTSPGQPVRETVLGPEGRGTLEASLTRTAQPLTIVVEVEGQRLADSVEVQGQGPSSTAALLGLELAYDLARREFTLLGRGQAHLERSFGDWSLRGGLDLDVGDVLAASGNLESGGAADPEVLLRSRALAFERELDPESFPAVTGDDGLSGTANPAGGRLWAKVRHERFGELSLGSVRADLSGAEVGRYHRALFGGLLDARLPLGPVTLRGRAFGAGPAAVPGEPQATPAHDELWGTGGSLFFLQHGQVLPGSEALRVEVRDGVTGMALEERPLVRHRDYEIDYVSGRILLASPLSMTVGAGPLLTTPLQAHRPVLAVDYQFRGFEGARAQVLGGGAGIQAGRWLELSGGAVKEHRLDVAEADADYRLFAARARSHLGPVTLAAELAHSEGRLLPGPGAFSLSDTGGLTAVTAPVAANLDGALAWSVRASVSEEDYGGQVWARGREAGFSDAGNASAAAARQFGGQARAQLGRFELAARFDDRRGADPRDPLGAGEVGARDGALRLTGRFGDLRVTAEGSFGSLELAETVSGEDVQDGGRVGAGLRLDYALTPELSVNASHHQRVWSYGAGPGSLDDTFAAVGASWRPRDELGFSLRGGWGPGVGTQIQAGVERGGADELAYGLWTTDVDGPSSLGTAAAVSGARRRVGEDADVYVEHLFARDPDALRMARAVGLQLAPARGVSLGARYERGGRLPFTGGPALLRDVGSGRASVAWKSLRVGLLAEVRRERGEAVAESAVERWQTVGGLTAELRPHRALSLGGRVLATRTRNHGVDEDGTVEGYAAAALRLEPWVVLASYSVTLRSQAGQGATVQHVVALRPGVVLFDRLRLGAGLYAGFFRAEQASDVYALSLRPAVRIVGGLEVAGEYARRSSAPDGESLDAVRAEVAYWFEGVVGVAVGYSFHGYSGTGVTQEPGHADRVYLRVEAAY